MITTISPAIGIDLGTANTLIYVKNKGIVINEPSIVAIDCQTQKVLAVGNEAKAMLGRTHAGIKIVKPIQNGIIADYDSATMLINYYLKSFLVKSMFGRKPLLVISTPSHLTSVEKRAVIDAAMQSGAKDVHIIEESFASAIGAGLPVWEPKGTMVVNIGAGSTEIAVISLGGIVVSHSTKMAGDEMDQLIIKHVKKKHQLIIGTVTAEKIKIHIYEEGNDTMLIRGRDMINGLPHSIEISKDEISLVLREALEQINLGIRQALEQTPPELASDIIQNGLILSGGVALLPIVGKSILDSTNLSVIISENPIENVVIGTSVILDNINLIK